jgi:hypothetical protein
MCIPPLKTWRSARVNFNDGRDCRMLMEPLKFVKQSQQRETNRSIWEHNCEALQLVCHPEEVVMLKDHSLVHASGVVCVSGYIVSLSWRMLSPGMWLRVAIVRTDVLEDPVASIRVTINSELGTTLAVISNWSKLLTRTTRRHIQEDGILYSHTSEHLKSYITLTGWARYRRRNVFLVRYELGFYIPEDGIRNTNRRENLKSYVALTGYAL